MVGGGQARPLSSRDTASVAVMSRQWLKLLAPIFALTGLFLPALIALGTAESLQSLLLIAGMTGCLVSGMLLLYRLRPARVVLHIVLLGLPIALFFRLVYAGAITPGVLLSVAGTSTRETLELLAGHFAVSLLLVPLVALTFWSIVASWSGPNPFSTRGCLVAGGGSILMVLGSLAIAHRQAGNHADLPAIVKDGLKTTFPVDLAYSLGIVVVGEIDTHRSAAARANFSFPNVQMLNASERSSSREIYVIVIGEASRRENWSLHGYPRRTTPRLDAIRQDLVVFDHATSNATITIFSIPLALTRATPSTFATARSEKSVIGLLRQGGFTVDWISNQERYGRNANLISALALDANSASFREDSITSMAESGYDSNLLTRLSDVLARSPADGKVVIFLHMIGSHFKYAERYPAEFAKFRGPSDSPRILTQWQTETLNEYDNSIYYTDYVVRGVIDQLSQCQCRAAALYFSDHGERLFDGGADDGEFGHGFPTVSRPEIEVPLFFWFSADFKAVNHELVARLETNAHSGVELETVFESMVDLTGLQYAGRVPEESVFSQFYRPPSQLEILTTSGHNVALAPNPQPSVEPAESQPKLP
jgi:glucan phosphoethanolaminetransferase (alkaline phosphatase superfamily)